MGKDTTKRMKELIDILNEASKTYYAEDREIISNFEYDKLYDELAALEKETGTTLAGSPTVKVGYDVVDYLPHEEHASPMLSLDKTKDINTLISFIDGQKTLLSWKMDGLTIVLTYREGNLFKGVTRGNGIVGEVITSNVRAFKNVPLKIPYKGELVIRGEAVIKYSDFEKINEEISDEAAKYKNPRNLCSGSVRQLNSEITAKRNVYLYVFSMVSCEGIDFNNSHAKQFEWLKDQGFDIVEYEVVDSLSAAAAVKRFEEKIATNDFPSDGLVALYDDISYGESLGNTAKFPRNAFAFKWEDETKETILKEIEWNTSRTGLINPVAIFDPVELEGTTVSRASVHNVSMVKSLKLGIGDKIRVYKANMIIPQIAENLTKSGNARIPGKCPVCLAPAVIVSEEDSEGVETLHCTNEKCVARRILSFALFVNRDALNVEGLSEATLEKFIAQGFIHDLGDIFELDRYKVKIMNMEGFGEKSYNKIITETENAKNTTLSRLLYGLGIPNVGVATAKLIAKTFDEDLSKVRSASIEELSAIPTIGEVIARSVYEWFKKEENIKVLDHVMEHVKLEKSAGKGGEDLAGMTFVVTGSLQHFEGRRQLKELIEARGGKVSSSVSSNTDYLINNDVTSGSSKNKKAHELGIEIISEDDFINKFGNGED